MNRNAQAIVVSRAILAVLSSVRRADADQFEDFVGAFDQQLAFSTLTDRDLRVAWRYAESYSLSWTHEDKDMDGDAWPEARRRMEYVVDCLTQGRSIEDARLLRYSQDNE